MKVSLVLKKEIDSAKIKQIVEARGYTLVDKDPDLVLAVGGDGTILRAEHEFPQKPILAINAGDLGFLSDCDLEHLDQVLDPSKHRQETLLKLEVLVDGKKVDEALNDVDITSQNPGKAMKISISINGRQIYSYIGDGALFATPAGSTAYNLSTGGSIVDMSLDAFIISPINPHASKAKPIVVAADREITIKTSGANSPIIVVDGLRDYKVDASQKLVVRTSKSKAKLIRCKSDYFTKLSELLS